MAGAELTGKLTIDAGSFLSTLTNALNQGTQKISAWVKSNGQAKVDVDVDTSAAEKNLGGLGEKFKSLFSGDTLKFAAGAALASGVTAIAGSISSAFDAVIDKGAEFQAGVAELSAITGVSGDALTNLGQKARDLAKEFGGSAAGNVEAFKGILSKLGPQVAETPAALEEMTRAVNTLSAATGDDAAASMDALTTGLLQFQVPLDDSAAAATEMTKQMNVLAAGAKFGAAEVPQVADAIKVAGVAASGAKVSFEETNAAIQALAAGGKVGAEAGTALRNVLGKLGEGRFLPKDTAEELKAAGVDINKLGDTSLGFTDRLRELQKITKDAALTTKLFGTENAAAANILIRSVDAQDQLRTQITGTNTAFEQAAVRQATFSAQVARGKAALEDFAIGTFEKIQPVLSAVLGGVMNVVGGFVSAIGGLFSFIGNNQGLMIGLAAAVAGYVIAANAGAIATALFSTVQSGASLVTKAVTAVQWLWNAALSANPIGLVIAGVVALVAVIGTLIDAQEETTQEQIEGNKAELELVETRKKLNKEHQASAQGVIKLAAEYESLGKKANRSLAEEKRMHEVQNQLNAQYPGLISSTKSFAENLNSVHGVAGQAQASLKKLGEEMSALDKKSRELTIRQVGLESKVVFDEFADLLIESSGGIDFATGFTKSINAARNSEQLEAALQGLREKILIQSDDDLTDKEKTAALQKLAQFQLLREKFFAAQAPPTVAPPEEKAPEPAGPVTPPKTDEEKKRGELDLLKDIEAIRKSARDKEEEAAIKSIEDQAVRERAALKKKFDDQITDAETKQKELLGKLDENAKKENPDILHLGDRVATRKEVEDALQGAIDAQKIAIEKLRKDEAAALEKKIEADRLKALQDAQRKEIDDLKAQQEEITGVTVDALEKRFQLGLEIQERERRLLKTDEEKGQFNVKVARENAEAQAAIELAIRRENVEQFATLAEQQRELALIDVDTRLAEELARTDITEQQKTEIVRKAEEERNAIRAQFLNDTSLVHRALNAVRTALEQSFTTTVSDEEKKRKDERRESAATELQGLREKQSAGLLSLSDYSKQASKLQAEIDANATSSVAGFAAFTKKVGEQFTGFLGNLATQFGGTFDATLDKFSKGNADMTDLLLSTAGALSSVLVDAAAKNENLLEATLKSAGKLAFDFLQKMIPVWLAEAFGVTIASTGLLGTPLAIAGFVATTALLEGLVAGARGILNLDSGIDKVPGVYRGKDTVPAMLAPEEAVIQRDMNKKHGWLVKMIRRDDPKLADAERAIRRGLREPTGERWSIAMSGHLIDRTNHAAMMASTALSTATATRAELSAVSKQLEEATAELAFIRTHTGTTAKDTHAMKQMLENAPPETRSLT